MSRATKILLTRFVNLNKRYFNDPPVVPPTVPPVVPPTVPPVSPPSPPGEKTFTQAEVSQMMENHRKGLQTENSKLIAQLEEIRGNATLTQQQKDDLEARINTLSQQHLTKDQQTQEEMNKLKKKYDTDTKQLIEKEVVWKSRFENTLISNDLATASVQHKAKSARQLQLMFANQAKVVEEVDDAGKPTGNWIAKMPVEVTDPKTKVKTKLELPIVEAIGKLRDNDEFANLFDSDGRGGLGGSNRGGTGSGSGGNSNGDTMPNFAGMSTADFMAWRAKQGSSI